MAARRGPTYRRRELGKELRRLREGVGLTIQEAVAGLGFSDTKLGRVETGHNSLPKAEDLEKLLNRYGIEDIDDREFLMSLQRESLSRDRFIRFRHFLPSGMPMYMGLETDALEARAWHPTLIYGLLQSEAYARAQFMTAKPINETTTAFVENNVRLRMQRKERLTCAENPLTLRVILDEAALRRVMGSAEVMKGQYEEIERLNALDNVTVQILPMNVPAYRSDINFLILNFDARVDPIVTSDAGEMMTFTDKELDVWKYNQRFDAMRSEALGPSATAEFLHQLAQEL
ncbi:helix-turn-helix domain-containing protein [Streptomyces sp. NPDC051018]|uniref:helix-turn-helix domain-containing protein n=1 Tax=Streptomyces sp. NPDC051018 TaxID=3365639 RepID=UPI0037B588FF